MAIKSAYSDAAEIKEQITRCINRCMNSTLVEPTVKLEHIDASALFPSANDVKCFRQRFTEQGINYSWWGIGVDSISVHGLEKIENDNVGDGVSIENLWLSANPNDPQQTSMINIIRMGIHHDLF